jgi:streptomycin 6-kinase
MVTLENDEMPDRRAAVVAACERWGAEVEAWLEAEYSAVAAVQLPDGMSAIAKLPPPGIDHRHERDALAAWQGRGAVCLLDTSADGVLLLERAVPGHIAESDDTVASTTARLWIEPPEAVEWRRFDEAIVEWMASIEQWQAELGGDVVASAWAAVEASSDPAGWRLLHGDAHHGNILDAGARGWLAIDPQPLVGPPTYDLASALWNGPEGDVHDRIEVLADAADVDPVELTRWARFRGALSMAWTLDDGEPVDWGDRALIVARTLAR